MKTINKLQTHCLFCLIIIVGMQFAEAQSFQVSKLENGKWSLFGVADDSLDIQNWIMDLAVTRSAKLYVAPYWDNQGVFEFQKAKNSWQYCASTPDYFTSTFISSLAIDSTDHVLCPTMYADHTDPDSNKWTIKNSVVRWDDTHWTTVGNPVLTRISKETNWGTRSDINPLCIDSRNTLYTAYTDQSQAGKYRIFIVRLNGSNWEVIGSPESFSSQRYVTSITEDRNHSIIVSCHGKDSTAEYCLYRWTGGTTWTKFANTHELKDFVGGTTSIPVIYDVKHDRDGNMYCFGNFTTPEGVGYIAKWDGTHWTELGSHNYLSSLQLGTMYPTVGRMDVVDAQHIYISGSCVKNSKHLCYVARFDGSQWSDVWYSQSVGDFTMTHDQNGNLYICADFSPIQEVEGETQLHTAVFPVPCDQYLTIKQQYAMQPAARVEILSAIGQLEYTALWNEGQPQIEIPTSAWTPGLYQSRIYSTSGALICQNRFIVHH